MTKRMSARALGSRRLLATGAVVTVAAVTCQVVLGWSTTTTAAAPPVPVGVRMERAVPDSAPGAAADPPIEGGSLGEDDGAVPDGTTVFDDHVPGVALLDPALLGALRRAATAAADDGVTVLVESGWRSRAYQERLLREAVSEHGSVQEAARWVASPDTSAHVSGEAVDVGPDEAMTWLAENGDGYGLCRVYRNEPWHFELRPDADRRGCPRPYADPTDDPRMRG